MPVASPVRRVIAWLATWATVAVLTVITTGTPARAAATCTDKVVCPASIYFGASLPGLPRNVAGLQKFGADVGKQPTIANYFAAFGDQLDRTGLTSLAVSHRLPMITWSPTVKGSSDNPYPLTKIASGAYDTYLTAQARTLAAVPGRVVVRFAHEMNAGWFAWGRGVNGNTDARYVAAYRHVHDVVTAAGARNVIWVWSPAVIAGATSLAALYPGSSYVDWVGPDLYLPHRTDTVAALWNPVRANIDTFAANKPLLFAETGVAPGPTRPAQIADLVGSLLHTPRLVGIVWFEQAGSADWRVDADPAARAALAAQLANPWFGASGATALPPLAQGPPVSTSAPRVGALATAVSGSWRSGTGATTVTGHWYRCTVPADPASCVAVAGAAAKTYTPQPADWHTYLRYAERAANTAGSATAWSSALMPVQAVPATPRAPAVTAYASAVQVTFPAAPFGATHWLLSLDAKQMVPIPVGTPSYWLLNLDSGSNHTVGLAAADMTGASSVASASVSLGAVPMAGPSTPYLVVTGTSPTYQLPRAPAGAQAWLLTLDGVTTTIPITASTWVAPAVTPGVTHTWALAPAAGSGGPSGWGSVGLASTGDFVALGAPDVPGVTPVSTGATFTFPALPAGASGWQLTVGPTTYPPTTSGSMTVTGLASGYSASWSLRAVNAGARSVTVSGRFLPG